MISRVPDKPADPDIDTTTVMPCPKESLTTTTSHPPHTTNDAQKTTSQAMNGVKQLALTIGTLLSSQGAGATSSSPLRVSLWCFFKLPASSFGVKSLRFVRDDPLRTGFAFVHA